VKRAGIAVPRSRAAASVARRIALKKSLFLSFSPMPKFNYTQALVHVEIDVTKEAITFDGKTIPAHSIIGIGLGFTAMGKVVIGQMLGGIIGQSIARSGFNMGGKLNKKLSEIPKSHFGQMIITYNEDGKRKVLRISLNTGDETCMKMIETISKDYHDKFIGFGGMPVVEKTLKISHKIAIFITMMIILIIVGFIIYSGIRPGSY